MELHLFWVEFPEASSDDVSSHDGVSFTFTIPKLDGVYLMTSDGDVECIGFGGSCTAKSM